MPRGGSRTGTPGKGYSNRRDLNENRMLPVQAATGQGYGEAKVQRDAQRAVPMGRPVSPPAAAPGVGVSSAGPLVPIDAPSGRPLEPITAGAPIGPGPGMEVLPEIPEGVDPDLVSLAKQLPMLELMASQPTASVQFRNFVRRVRGAIPPNAGM